MTSDDVSPCLKLTRTGGEEGQVVDGDRPIAPTIRNRCVHTRAALPIENWPQLPGAISSGLTGWIIPGPPIASSG